MVIGKAGCWCRLKRPALWPHNIGPVVCINDKVQNNMHTCQPGGEMLTHEKQWYWCTRYHLQCQVSIITKSWWQVLCKVPKMCWVALLWAASIHTLPMCWVVIGWPWKEVSYGSWCWPYSSSNPVNELFHLQILFGSILNFQAALLRRLTQGILCEQCQVSVLVTKKYSFLLNGPRIQKLIIKAL